MDQAAFNYDFNPPKVTDVEAAILGIIECRRGRAAAIQAREIAAATRLPERTVREHIKCLIEKHAVLIGSATGDPAGYFIPETAEEIEAVLAQLYHRIASLAVRIARIKRISVEDVFGQLRLSALSDGSDRPESSEGAA